MNLKLWFWCKKNKYSVKLIKGKNAYLYRAVDSKGNTIDFFVLEHRDEATARKFFKKALNANQTQRPRVITTDKYEATEIAILEETYYGDISCTTEHRMCKYLNNIIEQDHTFIMKKIDPMLGFKTLDSTEGLIGMSYRNSLIGSTSTMIRHLKLSTTSTYN